MGLRCRECVSGPVALTNPDCLFSDFGFKMSEDLSLEACVPDPEFSRKSYSPPVPCPVGSTYRRTRGYVSQGQCARDVVGGYTWCEGHREPPGSLCSLKNST